MATLASDHARRGNERGDSTRSAIVAVLRERLREGHQAPTLDEIVTATGLGKTTIRYHINLLAIAGTIRYQKRREIVLTEHDAPPTPDAVRP